MNFVQPIRDSDLIEQICFYLKYKNERDYILFLLGIYTALRISDILKLKVKDLKNKNYITINEQKTKRKKNNKRTIEIHSYLKRELKKYLEDKEEHEYVIKSRKGINRPISRERAYMILKDIADKFHLESLGCHSMRKTMGYHLYKKTKDLVLVQQALNHEDTSYTLRYIGIEQDTVNNAITKLNYFN